MMNVRRVKTLIATKCVFFGWSVTSVAVFLWFSLAGRISLKSVCGAKLWYHRYLPCAIEILCRIWYYFRVQGSRPVPTYFHGTTTLHPPASHPSHPLARIRTVCTRRRSEAPPPHRGPSSSRRRQRPSDGRPLIRRPRLH